MFLSQKCYGKESQNIGKPVSKKKRKTDLTPKICKGIRYHYRYHHKLSQTLFWAFSERIPILQKV